MSKFEFRVDKGSQVLAWQVRDNLELQDMPEIVNSIKTAAKSLQRGQIKLLIDNRYMIKNSHPIVFATEVNSEWEELQSWIMPYCQKVAVLCNGATMKM